MPTTSFAQSNTLFNPDYNGDGFIGVDDILGALSFYDTAWDGPVSPSWSCGEAITYAGVGYSTVQIGDQCWFAENLRTTTYLNGDSIPQNLSNGDWSSTTSGAMTFNNDGPAYGGLYNWYAVDDARGLCPSSWHVPTDAEWTILTDNLGGESVAGSQMKMDYGWYAGGNGTNSSGFSGLPGGYATQIGSPINAGNSGYFWSSSPNGSNPWSRGLANENEYVGRYDGFQRLGLSVRCVRCADDTQLDALGVCGGSCSADADADGICDDVDPCVGELDACGVCNGPGEIYECGCADIPEGDCDCDGNVLDECDVCGGDGIPAGDCDCDGNVLDECGICGGDGIPVGDCDCDGNQLDALGVCGGSCSADADGDGICDDVDPAQFQCGNPISYHDYDYATVLIGAQCWFAENLRSENYENGDGIPSNLSDSEWQNTTTGAVAMYGEGSSTCYDYSPDGDSCDEAWSMNEYGRLYNWYAVDDSRGLCPSGWHVPSDAEWTILTDHLGGESVAGGQMKMNYGWFSGGHGTNLSGFSGLPGGYRWGDGSFYDAGGVGTWWSSSPDDPYAWFRYLHSDYENVNRNDTNPLNGFSVRCVRDAE